MPEGKSKPSSRLLPGLALVAVFAVVGGYFATRSRQAAEPARPVVTGEPAPPAPGETSAPPAVAPTADFETFDRNDRRGYSLVLDRAVLRKIDGTDRILPLSPAATPTTLRARLLALDPDGQVWPLCREAGSRDTTLRIVTAEILVRLASKDTEPPALPAGLTAVSRPEYAPDYLLVRAGDPFAALAAAPILRGLPGVVHADVQLATWRQRRTMPADPLVAQQWHLKYQNQPGAVAGSDINVENAWLFGTTGGVRGAGIRVGVVDDGLETAHPDLAANVDTTTDKDWNGNDSDPNPGSGDNHGTACAGNVAAVAGNSLGGCGSAPEAKLVGLRLIAAATTDSQEADAMNYLATGANLIHVKTNSWGPTDDGKTLEGPGPLTVAALANATSQGRNGLGTVFMWAGGNGGDVGDNSNYDGYANNPHVIAIGASDSLGHQAYYSEPGANLACVAPSGGDSATLGITTTDRSGSLGYNTSSGTAGNYYADFSGTSSATPTAAGVVALVLQKNPALGWRDVKEILMRSARKIAPTDGDWTTTPAGFHFNHKFGAGLIDATAAVTLANGWFNLPAATSTSVSASGLPLAIPDNNATGITRTFVVGPGAPRAEHVTVTLDITHTYRGDLAVTLTSPTGMTSRLAATHSDPGNNYSNWTFSSVRHWGELTPGTWTLKVADLAAQDTGTLNSATLTVTGVPTNFAGWIAGFPGLSDASPGGDPDHDGLSNLAEYYLGGRPDVPDAAARLPHFALAGNALTLDWWHPKSALGVTATAEASATLEPNSWSSAGITDQTAADTGNAEHHMASLPVQAGETRKFLRLRFAAP